MRNEQPKRPRAKTLPLVEAYACERCGSLVLTDHCANCGWVYMRAHDTTRPMYEFGKR